jgi:hypothetical protein
MGELMRNQVSVGKAIVFLLQTSKAHADVTGTAVFHPVIAPPVAEREKKVVGRERVSSIK